MLSHWPWAAPNGIVSQLRAILAELDLLMAIDASAPSQICVQQAPNASDFIHTCPG